ncbi:helix-turn-helix domain-containing protein [Chamaesiphon minutus]|uniref:helix-turn-helix domain-containing protein n=1 Tax=Chamaesiphon minutus TaxID=1173032 RepID=UPI000B34A25B
MSWLNKRQRQTNRYQEYIYEKVKESTVKQVSDNEKMSENAVQDIFHKVAKLKKSGCAHAFVSRRFSAPSKTGGCLSD